MKFYNTKISRFTVDHFVGAETISNEEEIPAKEMFPVLQGNSMYFCVLCEVCNYANISQSFLLHTI